MIITGLWMVAFVRMLYMKITITIMITITIAITIAMASTVAILLRASTLYDERVTLCAGPLWSSAAAGRIWREKQCVCVCC